MQDFFDFITSHQQEILKETLQHIWLTFISLALAAVAGIGTGIFITRKKRLARSVMAVVNVVQTIPSLALLGFLLPLIGIGSGPAIVALFLYSLLPIVRNTFIGIEEVEPAVKEAALSMGFSNWQLLTKVELPLAAPVIFAGLRTATVLSIGIATLCAYIAAGGLGTFIFRGIALNNSSMILAGALPAALLALLLDYLLAILQGLMRQHLRPVLVGMAVLVLGFTVFPLWRLSSGNEFLGGFHPEFMERKDGYPGMSKAYNLEMQTVELDAGLMYEALKEGKVDVIGGYSSDGRIDAYDLFVLQDDKNYFPPYYAAPVVNQQTLQRHPQLREALNLLAGKIGDQQMRRLNFLADDGGKSPEEAALEFLQSEGFKTKTRRQGPADVVIGGKNFTEQYILAEMLAIIIENYTTLNVETRTGLGGTKICFEALVAGEIDLYVEYTGTGLLVLLNPPPATTKAIMGDREAVYQYVKQECLQQFGMVWLQPLGFNNSYALMVRKQFAAEEEVRSIGALSDYLGGKQR